MLDRVAERTAAETVAYEREPAVFQPSGGAPSVGDVAVDVSRASIALEFAPRDVLDVAGAAYGEANGSIAARSGAWIATAVNHAGAHPSGEHLFGTMALRVGSAEGKHVAATRLVFAGAAWGGSGTLDGRRVVVQPLSGLVVSHHDRRLGIAIDGVLSEATIETLGRAASFVSGIDVELVRVEQYGADGEPLTVEHRRGYRRVGRGPHSPFTGVADADRMRAWLTIAQAVPQLVAQGVPIDYMIDQISAHNQVAQIHVSAQLLLLSTVTAAYQRLHGQRIDEPAACRTLELERLNDDVGLGLGPKDIERFENIRVELLDGGFFHAPGYETGRPQKDIKFIRDVAHLTVFRLCGYTGPFYGAERFVVREL